jgi:hypothetical protein
MRSLRHRVPHARGNAGPRVKRYTVEMGRFAMAAALGTMLAAPLSAAVEVTAAGDRLDVVAARAPLSEVLDGLARKTRMKVVYEGPRPQTLVTVELKDRTPAQAVLGVLEGLGLNYALALDASGTEVETLMIVGTIGATTPSAGNAREARGRGSKPAPNASPDDPDLETEEPVEVEARAPAVPHDVPESDKEGKAEPAPPGPLNPTAAFPNSSPFAPGPPPLVGPSPSPPPPDPR